MLTQTLPRSQAAIHLEYPFACLPCLITYLATCVYTNPPPTHRPTDLHIDIQSRRHVMYIYTRRNTDAKKHRHVTQEARTHTRTHTHIHTHTHRQMGRHVFRHGRRGSTRSSEASIQPALRAARRQFVCSGRVLSCIAQSSVGVPPSDKSPSMQSSFCLQLAARAGIAM